MLLISLGLTVSTAQRGKTSEWAALLVAIKNHADVIVSCTLAVNVLLVLLRGFDTSVLIVCGRRNCTPPLPLLPLSIRDNALNEAAGCALGHALKSNRALRRLK